jgi:hypothetical protein
LPDDSRIDVIFEETHIATIIVHNNKAKIDTEDNLSIGVPNMKAGRRLQIKPGDTIVAKGQYREK